jgi:MFS family permease
VSAGDITHPRQFHRLWGSAAASNGADGLAMFAGPLLAAALTRDPVLIATLAVTQQLPWLLFPLISGAIVDRLDRRRVMAAVQLTRVGLIGGLGVVVALDAASLPLLYAVFFLVGVAETVFDPASVTVLPTIVRRADLPRANARLAGTMTVMNQFTGPPLGGLLFGLAAATPFLVAGSLYAAAAAGVLALRGSFRQTGDGSRPTPRRLATEIGEGVRWLVAHRFLRTLAITIGVMNVTMGGILAIMVLVAYDRLGLTAFQFGLFNIAYASGGVIAALLAHRVIQRFGSAAILRWGLVLEILTWVVFGVSANVWVVGAVWAAFGFHAIAWGTVSVTVRQTLVPSALLGRVTSAYMTIAVGGSAIGALIGGLLVSGIGLTAPFWFAVVLDTAVLGWAWRTLGRVPVELDESPAEVSNSAREQS